LFEEQLFDFGTLGPDMEKMCKIVVMSNNREIGYSEVKICELKQDLEIQLLSPTNNASAGKLTIISMSMDVATIEEMRQKLKMDGLKFKPLTESMLMCTYYSLKPWPKLIPSQASLEALSREKLVNETGI
jgi:hypothetical protein